MRLDIVPSVPELWRTRKRELRLQRVAAHGAVKS